MSDPEIIEKNFSHIPSGLSYEMLFNVCSKADISQLNLPHRMVISYRIFYCGNWLDRQHATRSFLSLSVLSKDQTHLINQTADKK